MNEQNSRFDRPICFLISPALIIHKIIELTSISKLTTRSLCKLVNEIINKILQKHFFPVRSFLSIHSSSLFFFFVYLRRLWVRINPEHTNYPLLWLLTREIFFFLFCGCLSLIVSHPLTQCFFFLGGDVEEFSYINTLKDRSIRKECFNLQFNYLLIAKTFVFYEFVW